MEVISYQIVKHVYLVCDNKTVILMYKLFFIPQSQLHQKLQNKWGCGRNRNGGKKFLSEINSKTTFEERKVDSWDGLHQEGLKREKWRRKKSQMVWTFEPNVTGKPSKGNTREMERKGWGCSKGGMKKSRRDWSWLGKNRWRYSVVRTEVLTNHNGIGKS